MAEDPPKITPEASATSEGMQRAEGIDERSGGYPATLLLGLLCATAVVVGVARPWVGATATVPGLPTLEATTTGAGLSPLAGALGVALLAAFGAVVATGGWVRRALGLVITAAAVGVLAAGIWPGPATASLAEQLAAKGYAGGGYETSTLAWRWVALAGAVGCAGAGAMVVRFGARWPSMGSRYDAPAVRERTSTEPDDAADETRLWRALDRGHDPTQTR